jgi:hypothetical protein
MDVPSSPARNQAPAGPTPGDLGPTLAVRVRPKDFFPWAMVDRARGDGYLQHGQSASEARLVYLWTARACPTCGLGASALSWFYFRSDDWTWERRCGTAGWMTVCDPCRVQVNFFMEEASAS